MHNNVTSKIEAYKSGIQYLFSGNFFTELFNSNSAPQRENVYKLFMLAIFLGYFLTSLLIVDGYGISGDEKSSHQQSERVFKYFAEGDSAAYVNTPGYLHLYGLSGNVIAELIAKAFHEDQLWSVRHHVNIIYASIGVIYISLLGLRIAGGLGGLISLLFIILSPRYFGHSFNNLLDIPFAVGYSITLFYIIRFFDFWPKIKLKYAIGLILGISFTISNRAPGVMVYAYFLLYAGIFYIAQISKKEFWKIGKFKKDIFYFILWAIPVIVVSYGLSLLIWPFGLKNPIKAIPKVMEHFSLVPVYMTTLFNGVMGLSNTFPRTYAPVYLTIGVPLFINVGFLLYFVLLFKKKKLYDIAMPFLVFTALFPVVYIVYKKANLYSGMRHLTFIIPSLVLVATAGWVKLLKSFKTKKKLIPVSLLIILMFLPLRHMIANHPNQYIYFNELIGGMKGGYANYDMDYFYNSIKNASEWLKENEELEKDSITIITNASYTGYFDDYPNVKMRYSRYYEKGKKDWDYAIYSNVFIRREQLLSDWFPPKNTIYTIDVDGYPVAFIFKRNNKEDYLGFEASKKGKRAEAKQHFRNFLELYPENEEVLEGYSRIMLQERKLDSTIIYADSSLIYNPRQMGALLLKASAYNTQKKYTEALTASNKMLEIKEEFAEGQFQKGFALKNLSKPNEALKAFQKAIAAKKEYYQAHMQMGEILTNYKNYKKANEIYNKVLEFKENDLTATVYSAKCFHLQKNNIKAEELLKSIPNRNQNNLVAVMLKCRIAISKNDLQNAGRYLQMARNINNNAELFVLRASYVLKQNRKDLAKQYLDKAIELDPINREAQELIKSLQTKTTPTKAAAKQKPTQQQSIMFQKPKPKKNTSPIKVPTN